MSVFSFLDDNFSKYQWIYTKLGIALILWRSALGLLMGKFRPFLTELSACNTSVFYFQDNNLSKSRWISPNLIRAFILWRSALGLLIGKFCQF